MPVLLSVLETEEIVVNILKKILFFSVLSVFLCLFLVSCGDDRPEGITVRDLTWGVGGPLPKAADFFESLPEGWTADFEEDYRFDKLGEYSLKVVLRDDRGRTYDDYEVRFTLVNDQEPPVIT